MSDQHDRIEVLTSFKTEYEAGLLANELEARGIRAQAVGGYTAGFRAEAPGEVKVLVFAADLPRAREILAEFHGDEAQGG